MKMTQLISRFGKNISFDNVLGEYPRPMLKRDSFVSLNGVWKYEINKTKDHAEYADDIIVPFSPEAYLSKVQRILKPGEFLHYKRTFRLPTGFIKDRVILHFGAVDQECEVKVNGKRAGSHKGGYLPFEFDITDSLAEGDNTIEVLVTDLTENSPHARGKQRLNNKGICSFIFYTPQSGIWKSVWLESVREHYITGIKMTPDYDDSKVIIKIETNAETNRGRSVNGTGLVTIKKEGSDRTGAAKENAKAATEAADPGIEDSTAMAKVVISFKGQKVLETGIKTDSYEELYLENFTPWSPEEPNLYDAEVTLLKTAKENIAKADRSDTAVRADMTDRSATADRADTVVRADMTDTADTGNGADNTDKVSTYFAMRKVNHHKGADGIERFYLNDRPYFFNGVLNQGYWPESLLTEPSDEAIRYDILKLKELGFNTIRCHVKIESERFYYYCDLYGMAIWQDMPNGGSDYDMLFQAGLPNKLPVFQRILKDKNYKRFGRTDSEGRRQYYEDLEGMIRLLYDHPSIVEWTPFNEGWGQFDAPKATELIRRIDTTRIINEACGWFDQKGGDVYSIHNYNPGLKVKPQGSRVIALTEFGGYARAIKGHCFSDTHKGYEKYKSKKDLTDNYIRLMKDEVSGNIKNGLCAAIYTQTSDIENEVNGLMTYDRELLKMDESRIIESNKQLYAEFEKMTADIL